MIAPYDITWSGELIKAGELINIPELIVALGGVAPSPPPNESTSSPKKPAKD